MNIDPRGSSTDGDVVARSCVMPPAAVVRRVRRNARFRANNRLTVFRSTGLLLWFPAKSPGKLTEAAMQPVTQYAKSGDVHVAYQVFGNGPINLVMVPGFVSNI